MQKHKEDDTKKHVQERGFTIENFQAKGYEVLNSKSY